MNGGAKFGFLPLPLLVAVCFAGTNLAPAQQSSGGISTGTYSSFAPQSSSAGESLSPGRYSSDSSVLRGESLPGLASRMGLANVNSANANPASTKLTSKADARSAWLAGSSSVGGASLTGWKAGSTGFAAHSGSSWIAGANSFGLARQESGIWRAMPPAGVESLSAAQTTGESSMPSIAPGAPRLSTSLTAKGAGLVKSGAFLSPSANRQGTNSGFRRSGAGAFGTRSTFGGRQSPFASHSGRFGSSGVRSGSSSTQSRTPSETLTGPSLNDSLQWNGDLESPDTLDQGSDKSTTESSH
jgi:hypothetical protein